MNKKSNRKFWVFVLLGLFSLLGLTYAITPYETILLAEEDQIWMMILNMKEMIIYSIGILSGIMIGRLKFEK